jgi:NitT/TauT family transport system permease protein
VVLAALSHAFRVVRALFAPVVDVINAVPIASFAVMALLAFNREHLAVFVVFITVLPIFYMNTLTGLAGADGRLLEMAGVLRAPRRKIWRYIFIPAALPHIIGALQVGMGFAWKSGVAAELIGLVRGTIGGSLHTARISLLTADLFAWTVTILALSWACQTIVRMLLKWHRQ